MSLKRRKDIINKLGCAALSVILASTLFLPLNSYASGNFSDVYGHWAENYIRRAYNLEIVSGYPGGRFLPDKTVTRAEFVSMVNHALDIDTDMASSFNDIYTSQWFYEDVATAVSSSYAGGYSDNTFRPNNPISRQEAAVMLSRILPSYKEKSNLKNFKDYRTINDWALSAMEKLTSKAYMGAYSDGKIHPNDPLTRAQTAKILCDILDNETIVNQETMIEDNNTKFTGKIFTGDVVIEPGLGEGNATIENCVVLGTLIVEGGGSKSITINNSRVAGMIVDKDETAVRIVTKGTTLIPKVSVSQSCLLQTSGKDGTGIQEVTVNEDADVKLKGNFPLVNVKGSSATVTLESGKITDFTVQTSGDYSDIILTGKAEITEATVNAEAYFHGEGTIGQMNVNADNITYETKPVKMTVGVNIDRAIGEEDSKSDITVDIEPANKERNVDIDTKITLTFNTSVKLTTGAIITSSNISNFVTLRALSKSGSIVECSGTINASNKIVTLTPNINLNPNTKYYVVLGDESVMSAGGSKNEGDYIYFTTGTSSSNSLATYDPDDGDTGVSSSKTITIKFSRDVVKYSDGSAVTDAYLQECILFRAGGASTGSAVTFTATITSRNKVKITPTASLTAGQKYYVAVIANKLKTAESGKAITASCSTWTVAPASTVTTPSAATLTTLSLAPSGGSNVLTGFSASTTTYNVTVPFNTASVDVAATAASGTTIHIKGAAVSTANIPVSPGAVTSIQLAATASNMNTTSYVINVQVAGNTDLSDLSINGISLQLVTGTYYFNVASSATTASISVTTDDLNGVVRIGSNSGIGSCTAGVSLGAGSQDITFTVTSNLTVKTYTIHFSRLKN